jgi:hypothetical protein
MLKVFRSSLGSIPLPTYVQRAGIYHQKPEFQSLIFSRLMAWRAKVVPALVEFQSLNLAG